MLIKPFFRHKHSAFSDKILIINTEKMGDLLLSADFMYSLRIKNKKSHNHLLLNESFNDLFNWSAFGYSPVFINKNKYRYNLIYRFRFIKLIRSRKYKTVINITQERGMINDELALISGARKIIAMKKDSIFIPGLFLRINNKLYDEIFISKATNEYIRLKEFLTKEKTEWITGGKMFYSASDIPEVKHALGCIVIAPMVSEMERSWGLDNFRSLCGKIDDKILLVGAKQEYESLEYVRNGRNNITNLAGLGLADTSVLLSKCLIYIGNDSGLTHLAHQLVKPVIAIIGGCNFGKFFPYKERADALFLYYQMDCFGCDRFCIHDKRYCLTEIKLDQVINSIKLLKGNIRINSNRQLPRI